MTIGKFKHVSSTFNHLNVEGRKTELIWRGLTIPKG